MTNFVYFLHVLGAISVGFYFTLPFVAARLKGMDPKPQNGLARGLYGMNRVGQWLLVIQFLTGGYLISKFHLTWTWIIVVLGLFFILGAMVGMLGAPLRRIIQSSGEGNAPAEQDLSKLVMFSAVSAVMVLLLTILMFYSGWI